MSSTREAILLITGITGYGTGGGELVNVVNNLRKNKSNQDTFVWHHPMLSDKFENTDWPTSIPALASLIIDDFLKENKAQNIRVYGYSFGGVLVHEVTRQLQAKGKNIVIAGVIDSPHPDLLKQELVPGNSAATTKLIRIMQHAAQLAQCDPNVTTFSLAEVKEISKRPIIEQLATIREKMSKAYQVNKVSPAKSGLLLAFELVIADYLALLAKYEIDESLKLDKLLVMTTEETRNYYHCKKDAGWNNVAHEIVIKELDGTHTSILDQQHADQLTACLIESVKSLSSTARSQSRLSIPAHRKTIRSSSPSSASSNESSDEETIKMDVGSPLEKSKTCAYTSYNTRSHSRFNRFKSTKDRDDTSDDNSSDSDVEMKKEEPHMRHRGRGFSART